MKKYILLLAAVTISLSVLAQDATPQKTLSIHKEKREFGHFRKHHRKEFMQHMNRIHRMHKGKHSGHVRGGHK